MASKSPFPGMDPYLEQHWRDVHASLITYSRDQLQPQLPDDLLARTEERVFVQSGGEIRYVMYPDVRVVEHPGPTVATASAPAETSVAVAEPLVFEMETESFTETFIEILEAGSGNRVVTVIEFLSLTNKMPGQGQNLYVKKQQELIGGRVSLVEIDLLRTGQRVQAFPESLIPRQYRTPYRACVLRGWKPGRAEFYPITLRRRLPIIRIPLREKDADVYLDLQTLIDPCYNNGRYHLTDYTAEPEPALDEEDAAWANGLLKQAGKRKASAQGTNGA